MRRRNPWFPGSAWEPPVREALPPEPRSRRTLLDARQSLAAVGSQAEPGNQSVPRFQTPFRTGSKAKSMQLSRKNLVLGRAQYKSCGRFIVLRSQGAPHEDLISVSITADYSQRKLHRPE